jgi:PAS domain S-box-containing protein
MSKKKTTDSGSLNASELRRKAERQMRTRVTVPASAVSEADARALVHELQVHQIELEMQNEELRRAQAAAAEASEKYLSLFDFAPIGYFLWDHQGRIQEVNLAGAALIGRDRGSVVQKRFAQFLAAEDRTRFSEYCQLVLANDIKQSCEFKILRDGQEVEVLIEAIAAQDQQGEEKFCRAAAIDTTQRKRAEDLLRRSEEHFRALAEALPQIVWTADAEGAVDWFNHRWYDYTGQKPGEGEGWSWQSVAHPDDIQRTLEKWQRAVRNVSIFENEIRIRRSDGEYQWFLVRAWPLQSTNGDVVRWFGTNTDIHKIKAAQEALLISEARLRLAQQAAHIGTFEWDLQKDVNTWTPELEAMYGLPIGGFARTQHAWEDLVHPDDRAAAVALVEESLKTGAPTEGEWRVIWPDGSLHWLFGRWQVFKDKSGRPLRMTGVNMDISERKRAEEEIRSLAELPQENPNPVLRISSDGLVYYANPSAIKLLELMGWQAGQALPVLIREQVQRKMEESETREFDLVCAVGRTFSFAVAASSRAGMINLYARDITLRKQAEESLRKMNELLEQRVAERTAELLESMNQVYAAQKRFHEVLDALPVYVILLTHDYHVSFANRFFEDRFGKSEGRRCYEYLFNRAEPCENCETFKVLKTNAPHHWEWMGPDGLIYDIHDFPFIDVDGSRLILEVGTDITLRRQDERALAERTAEVQRLADQLRALAVDLSRAEQRERKRVSIILHDHIQQLLVAARMQVGWLKHGTNVEQVHSIAQGADSILGDALDASRSLTVELSPPVLHEAGLIGGLTWLVSRMQEKHHLKVNLRSDTKAEPASEELRLLLFECVRELLFNTVKHAGVSEAHVTLMRTRDNRIKLIIRDEGRGFDPGLLNKRGADDITFGLFSIQQRLAYIGGEMEILAAPGKGTSIHMIIPDEKASAQMEKQDRGAGRIAPADSLHLREKELVSRVLVVDDHKIMREGLVGLMQFERDIEIVGQAADGPQAIELAELLQPDVIIMDISLPGMSGVEATKLILARAPNTRIIGLSMHTDRDLANAMHDAGAIAYLTKGGPAEDLIAAIRAAGRSRGE